MKWYLRNTEYPVRRQRAVSALGMVTHGPDAGIAGDWCRVTAAGGQIPGQICNQLTDTATSEGRRFKMFYINIMNRAVLIQLNTHFIAQKFFVKFEVQFTQWVSYQNLKSLCLSESKFPKVFKNAPTFSFLIIFVWLRTAQSFGLFLIDQILWKEFLFRKLAINIFLDGRGLQTRDKRCNHPGHEYNYKNTLNLHYNGIKVPSWPNL